jgi:hypothetical protein
VGFAVVESGVAALTALEPAAASDTVTGRLTTGALVSAAVVSVISAGIGYGRVSECRIAYRSADENAGVREARLTGDSAAASRR